jgi:hypothetical protein
MAVIDLKMAVEVDTEQLDKLQEKMKQTDQLFLKKIEKATSILPKGGSCLAANGIEGRQCFKEFS